MEINGFADRVAHIDLTKGAVEYRGINEKWARLYMGARGLGVRYVLENGPEVDPLSPDNILCLMNGPLTGSAVNMSWSHCFCHKITSHRHCNGQPSRRLVGRAYSVGRLRWTYLSG